MSSSLDYSPIPQSLVEMGDRFRLTTAELGAITTRLNIAHAGDGTLGKKHLEDLCRELEDSDDRGWPEECGGWVSANGMARLYQRDAIDFLSSLPSNSIDIISTDPAYSGMNNRLKLGKGRIVGTYRDRGTEDGHWFGEFEDTPENYLRFLAECRRVLKSTGHLYIMFDSYSLLSLGAMVREFFDVKNIITWDKVNLGMGHYFRRRHEYIIFATNGNNRHIRNQSFPDVWRFKRIHRATYPTQKPVELFQAMIYASMRDGITTTVCDPFLGSGSSMIAALKSGCQFAGSDVSEKALQLSSKRGSMFLRYGADPLQEGTTALPGEPVFWE